MKKSCKIFLLILLSIIILKIENVTAYTVSWPGQEVVSGQSPDVRKYMTTLDEGTFMTYCIDPGRAFGGGDNKSVSTYQVARMVDPSQSKPGTGEHKFNIAATYIYQQMLANGFAGTNDAGRIVGQTAFRIVRQMYDTGGTNNSASLKSAYDAYLNMGAGLAKNEYVNIGIQYARDAAHLANTYGNMPYEELVKDSGYTSAIWTPTFEAVNYEMISKTNTEMKIRFAVRPGEGMSSPEKFAEYVGAFEAGCTNQSVVCTVNNKAQNASYGPAGVLIEMTIDISKWDQKDMGIYVDAAYCDPKAAGYQLALLYNTSKPHNQYMLVVLPGVCPAVPGTRNPPRRRVPVKPTENCECNYDKNNAWDGTYTITKFDKDGNVSEKLTLENGPQISQYTCPSPDECRKGKPQSCLTPSQSSDNKYHCKDGRVCELDEYNKECNNNNNPHNCQTPDESGDGKYYCKESKPGLGDGQPCTENEYNAQCQNINCSPTVSIPGTCSDFNENGEYLTGSISDINLKSNSCNSATNPVKQCVLGGKDATGTSYEATADFSGNKYCKVYCKENYDFKLPTARLSTSGEYFTLTMGISGTRSCYTSSAVDSSMPIGVNSDGTNQFEKDLEEARHAIIDAWNEYNHWLEGTNSSHQYERIIRDSNSDCIKEEYKEDCSDYCDQNGQNCHTECSSYKTCVENCKAKDEWTQIYHYWDYTVYNYDGSSGTAHQDEITNGGGSCFKCGCDGKDGVSQIPVFRQRAENIKNNRLIPAINRFYSIIKEYNDCSGKLTVNNPLNLGNKSFTSSSWENNMIFKPEVTFHYNENYLENVNGNFVSKGELNEKSSYEYCKGNVDNSYNCSNGVKASSNTLPNTATITKSFVLCDTNGCRPVSITYSGAQWVKKEKNASDIYGPNRTFSTLTPYGTIKVGQDGTSKFYTNLPDDALPIKLMTKTGAYPFKFTFKNIGQSNINNQPGRLIGDNNSVLMEFNNLPSSLKCSGTDKLKAEDATATVDGGYVCHYINNCPDCTGKCEPDEKCELCLPDDPSCNDPCTDNCTAYCKNCIFDGKRSTYTFRPISLNKINPNPRESEYEGWNWNNEYKGQITQKEIEADGEKIYEKPQFSITLTTSDLSKIREYNDKAGSFVNAKLPDGMSNENGEEDAIYCEKITINGIEYHVKCRSTFLDIIDERRGYGTIHERITRDEDGFELFIDDAVQQITGCGKMNNYACLAETGIGPSWRVKKVGGNS